MDWLKKTPILLWKFLASYGLACAILALLLILTLMGTLEQADRGIYDVQQKYFNSTFFVHEFFGVVPMLLPGAYLLLILLTVNLIAGALLRIKLKRAKLGILVVHVGIVLLFVGEFIRFQYSDTGQMTLFEGLASNEMSSYYDWEIAIAEARADVPAAPVPAMLGYGAAVPEELLDAEGATREWIIPESRLSDLTGDRTRTFTAPDLPFELEVSGYLTNCQPWPASAGMAAATDVEPVDGLVLQALGRAREAEQNIAGCYATVVDPDSGTRERTLLWGVQMQPWVVEVDGRLYSIDLRKRRETLPFAVALDDFRRELHPGTAMAASFESDVRKIEGDAQEKVGIRMNQPLRHKGYTLYQASWGPEDARPGEPLYSVFAVSRNPADRFPIYACVVVTLGMVVHFGQRLIRYLNAESRRARTTP